MTLTRQMTQERSEDHRRRPASEFCTCSYYCFSIGWFFYSAGYRRPLCSSRLCPRMYTTMYSLISMAHQEDRSYCFIITCFEHASVSNTDRTWGGNRLFRWQKRGGGILNIPQYKAKKSHLKDSWYSRNAHTCVKGWRYKWCWNRAD